MAKFLKSIFSSTDKKSHHYEDGNEEERADTPPMGGRRQLSISRSGRMRQANKKRHSLTLDLYGDKDDMEPVERPTSMEYHVHTPSCQTAPVELTTIPRRYSTGDNAASDTQTYVISQAQGSDIKVRKVVDVEKSPEEEIDNAFEVIDKS